MIKEVLQRRDLEILRTLARIRHATSRELTRAFFPSPIAARRRLRVLTGLDLIQPHRKGVPAQMIYQAWRLTAIGVEQVAAAFPDELVPDGLAEKLADANLLHVDHREAVSRIYLRLLGR